MISGLEPEIRRIVADLLAKMKGKTRIDVVDEFCLPLPVAVICKILACHWKPSRASTPGSRRAQLR